MSVPKLKDMNVIIFGERDQISSEVIEKAVVTAGANVLKTQTACFSWGSGESVGTADQKLAKEALDKYGTDKVIVILGFNSLFTLGSFPPDEFGVETGRTGWTMVKTFLDGDPAGAGALSQDNPPGIKSYVIYEFKDQIPEDVWAESLGDIEMMIEMDGGSVQKVIDRVKELRGD